MVFLEFFIVFLRRYLSNKSFLLCLLLIPIAAVGGVWAVEHPNDTTSMVVGVVVADEGVYGASVAEELGLRKDISFVGFDDRDTLMDGIAHGDVVAGYVLDGDFTQRVTSLQTKNLVERICLEGDVYHRYLDELVYTAIYRQMMPHITADFLESRGISASLEEIQRGTQGYLQGDSLFEVDVMSVQPSTVVGNSVSPIPVMRGVLAIGLLLLCLMGGAISAGQQGGWTLFAPHLGRLRCELYAIAPVYGLGLLAAIFSLLLVGVVSPHEIPLAQECLRLICYQLSLLIVGMALPKVVGRDTIVLLIPFILLFVLVTHPILFDVTALLPQLKPAIAWLPSYLYLCA